MNRSGQAGRGAINMPVAPGLLSPVKISNVFRLRAGRFTAFRVASARLSSAPVHPG
jgi:hypothetical protein